VDGADRAPVFELSDQREQFRQRVDAVHRPVGEPLGDPVDRLDHPGVLAEPRFDRDLSVDEVAHRRLCDADPVGDLLLGEPALVERGREHRPGGRDEPLDDDLARQHQRHTCRL